MSLVRLAPAPGREKGGMKVDLEGQRICSQTITLTLTLSRLRERGQKLHHRINWPAATFGHDPMNVL